MFDIFNAIIANKVSGGTGSSGGGLPSGGAPHQMLVTDADGKTVWEERTHYTDIVSTPVLEQQSITFIEPDGMVVVIPVDVLTDGKTYKVTWDGKEYICVCTGFSNGSVDFYAVGNAAMIPGAVDAGYDDTGEPFALVNVPAEPVTFACAAEAGTHDISVELFEENLKQIPDKYIPNSVSKQIEFNLSLGDDGGIVADITIEELSSYVSIGYSAQARLDRFLLKLTEVSTNSSGIPVFSFAGINGIYCVAVQGYHSASKDVDVWAYIKNGAPLLYNDGSVYELMLRSSVNGKIYSVTVDGSGTLTATEVTE